MRCAVFTDILWSALRGVLSLRCLAFAAFFSFSSVVARALGVARRLLSVSACGFGAHKTFLAVADQILSSEKCQSFSYERGVLRTVKLQKCALQLLFTVVGGNVYGLHIKRIYTRVEHYR